MTDDRMTMTTSHVGHDEVSLQQVLESVLRLQAEWSRDVTAPMRERGRQIRELGPGAIKRLITADDHAAIPDLAVRGGDGAGSRAKVPWIRVYSESRSPAPTVGWYATYLFAADGSVAYLSLNQGTTLPGFRSRPSHALRERVARARRILATEMEASSRLIAEIDLQDPSGLGAGYVVGNVVAFSYPAGQVPDDSSLAQDLHLILGLLVQLYGSNEFAEAVPADAQGTFATVRPSLSDARAFVAWMRTQYGPSLVETRRRAEDEARVLLDEHAGRMTREHAARLGELLNQGTWAEVPHQNRFSPAFMGRTLDVLVDPIETFNEWTSRLWTARDDVAAEQAVDTILKDPTAFPGAGRSYPTVIMYLRDSSRYAVWLRQTHRGLAAISGFGDPVGRTGGVARYLRYCEAANRFAQEQGLEPQEVDAVLSVAGRAAKDEESAPDVESIVLASDDADTGSGTPTGARFYPLTAVAAATYLPISLLEEWTELLNGDTRQALLYGPPGTGKTYVASQLALHLAGSPDRVSFVQFHPSFSYEDFIEGLRPSDAAEGLRYEVRPGLFMEFCQRAAGSDDAFVYLIDEINRADLGSVLGELLMLLEYRGRTIRLPYSQRPFSVPHNIVLLATMNTADRSLALVDYALRRRFHAFQMLPNRVVLADYLASRDDDVGPALELFDLVQNRVASDEVAPGHSYWMTKDLTATGLDRIWRYQLRPYLSEYWFEHPAQLQRLEADVATLLSEET